MVKLRVSDAYSAGGRVDLAFVLTQHSRDLSLIKCLADYFSCGQFYTYKDYAEFKCSNLKEIYETILPFFLKYPVIFFFFCLSFFLFFCLQAKEQKKEAKRLVFWVIYRR